MAGLVDSDSRGKQREPARRVVHRLCDGVTIWACLIVYLACAAGCSDDGVAVIVQGTSASQDVKNEGIGKADGGSLRVDVATGVPTCPALPACTCVGAVDGAACADGNPCTSGEKCNQGQCSGGQVPDCTGVLCQVGTCDPQTGNCAFAPQPDGTPCSDSSLCTVSDTCKGGLCNGKPATCDDGNVCTDDGCLPATGCTSTDIAGPCEDGNLCSEADVCAGGACKAGKNKACDDGDPCTVDVCDPKVGCVAKPASDGTFCGPNLACKAGQCVKGCKLFEAILGGDGADGFEAVVASSSGFVAAGGTSSKGAGASDGWLVKWSSDNSIVYDLALGTTQTEAFTGVASTQGLTCAAGYRGSSASSAGWLVGVDKLGAPLFDVTWGAGEQARFNAVAIIEGGCVAVGQHTPNNGKMSEGLVVAFDKTGAVLWTQSLGFQSNDVLFGVRSVPYGDIMVTGQSYTAGPMGDADAWVARLTKNGELVWSKQIGTAKYESARAMVIADQYVYATGATNSFGALGYDGYLLAVDIEGKVHWQKNYGTNKDDRFFGAAGTPMGGAMILVGETEPAGAIDINGWVVRVDGSGKLAWSKNFGSPFKDHLGAVATMPDGGLVVVGAWGGPGPTGQVAPNGWVMRFDSSAGATCD